MGVGESFIKDLLTQKNINEKTCTKTITYCIKNSLITNWEVDQQPLVFNNFKALSLSYSIC